MNKVTKAVAALMLMTGLICAAGCTKTDEPNNGGNNNEVEINYVEGPYVDFGLESGTLWGTCNLGATSPEGYGHYFAWGETSERDYYDWNHYKYANNSKQGLTKYCSLESHGYNGFTDTLTTLLPEDDAATAYGDDTWCMPTYAQWEELKSSTTATRTTLNGVNGMAFTRNGKSIFLPAGGKCWANYVQEKGVAGYYWSSTLNSGWPNEAMFFYIFEETHNTGHLDRANGYTIRPVRSANFHE